MKDDLIAAVSAAVNTVTEGTVPAPTVTLETPRNPAHGDYSTNIAMLLAKPLGRPPRDIATEIIGAIGNHQALKHAEVAGPGFINFVLSNAAHTAVIDAILAARERYGYSDVGRGQRIQIEFVSANPTGPLHVGHGRGAAYGSVLARLLAVTGHEVSTEYYVNDAGRQMDILAYSVWMRYREALGDVVTLPANAYQGGYIVDIARNVIDDVGDRYRAEPATAGEEGADDDPEAALDASIQNCKSALGEEKYDELHRRACDAVLATIKIDLERFGVVFDRWYSEREMIDDGAIEQAVDVLEQRQNIYSRGGAKWFNSSTLGDEKDRVVVRENGAPTYFASDIAYHADKYARGYDHLINIWGADHHGYIARVRAALTALGLDESKLEIILVQFAALFRHGEKVAMSTRSGEFVTLEELIDEVGADAARFFYITRRSDQHLDFDLDLAKSKSNENPVYYIQYAHARVCSIFSQLDERKFRFETVSSADAAKHLVDEKERALLMAMERYPDTVRLAALNREPHLLTHYLRELAAEFHAYYNSTRILIDDEDGRNARITLADCVRQVIANGLSLLSIEPVVEM